MVSKQHKFTQNYPTERADYPSSSASEQATPHKKAESASEPRKPKTTYQPVQGNPEEGGKISPEEAERISSDDLPS